MTRCAFMVFCLSAFLVSAQESMLVDADYPYRDSLGDYKINLYHNSIVFFESVQEMGSANPYDRRMVNQYDKESGQISTLVTDDDVEGSLRSFSTNGSQAVILSGMGLVRKHAYVSRTRDFSDLEKVYTVDDQDESIRFAWYYGGYVFLVTNTDSLSSYLTDIVMIDASGQSHIVAEDLPQSPYKYSFNSFNNYVVISPIETPINGSDLLVYDPITKSVVDPGVIHQPILDCEVYIQQEIYSNSIIYYWCMGEFYMYDYDREVYIDVDSLNRIDIVYDSEDLLLFTDGLKIFRYDRSSGETRTVVEGVMSYVICNHYIVILKSNTDGAYFEVYNAKEDEIVMYDPGIPQVNWLVRFSRVAEVESGCYFALNYRPWPYDTYLFRWNDEGMKLIEEYERGSDYASPLAYCEDIYFTKYNEESGTELYVIDNMSGLAKEVNLGFDMEVFPNPAHSTINISSERNVERILISNLSGQLLWSSGYSRSSSVDLDAFQSGTYIVKAINNEGAVSMDKLVIMK